MELLMVKILLLSFISIQFLYSFSLDLVELYRKDGINAVQKILEQQLTKQQYWQKNLQNKNLEYGYYESIQFVMLCQKNMKDIILYDTKQNKTLFSSSVFIGKELGDKKKEGDMKTPVGAYRITNRLTKVDPFYGPLALTTNYPNILDKIEGKTGHGIWIHGLPEHQNRDDYTQGCIALDNNKIKKLSNSINLKNSILLISEKTLQPVTKKDISLILSKIFLWRDAWKNSNISKYLSFYSEEFKKSNGQSLEDFKKYKTKLFKKDEKKTIQFSNINIIPYPNNMHKVMYKVVMDELYQTRNYHFDGQKELYVEVINGNMEILTES
jgi:murein L,D-transpeptidase YafK